MNNSLKANEGINEINKKKDRIAKYYLLLIFSVAAYSSVPIAGKLALNSFGPLTFAWLRGFSGFLVVLPFAYKRGFRLKQLFRKRSMFYGMIAFLFNTALFHVGMQWCSANISSMLQAFMPVMMLIGGVLFLNEKMTKSKEIGAILAVSGILITCIGGSLIDASTKWYGILMVSVAVLTWTIYTVFMKKYDADTDPLMISGYVLGCGSMLTFPFAVGESIIYGLPHIDFSVVFLVLFAGVVCLGLANMAWTLAVSRIDASISGLCYNLSPIFGVFIAVAFGETVAAMQWIGCVVVVVGVIVGVKDEEIFKRKKNQSASE